MFSISIPMEQQVKYVIRSTMEIAKESIIGSTIEYLLP